MRPGARTHGDDPHALAIVRLGVDVPYEQAWSLQRWVHGKRVAGELPDTVLILEHAPVYTAGKRTAPQERPSDGTPVIDVDRGGRLTWHGPGQLVAYPIVGGVTDVITYACRLEETMIQVCADFGVTARRVRGRGGVWAKGDASLGLPDRQLGAVGIRVSRGVTMHGFALNCANDPRWFNRIAPCGLPDVGVSSLSAETGRRIVVEEVLPIAEKRLAEALGMEAFELHEEDLLRR
ncbi:lipoyl(octanoyl) transferase LipB [Nonomuraea turcica]|uniref:lipoyl(octanoyl) transferase LipB n=1 Tax=Nonomuraea sp. G32 TaxID=3067274 RepID=UPI00273BA7AB|nr:lipoyl(octanoyl) transferase LipB [Nonomuraea sp. G32]MDP4506195.1 lipoyl(octanoyl) transferase LipB [Nonomuraea sp. G32]